MYCCERSLTGALDGDTDSIVSDHPLASGAKGQRVLPPRVKAVQEQAPPEVPWDAARRGDGFGPDHVGAVADLVVVKVACGQLLPLDGHLGVCIADHLDGQRGH